MTELEGLIPQRDIVVGATEGACSIPIRGTDPEADAGGITLRASRLGVLAMPTRTVGFLDGGFGDADADRWPTASDQMEVLAFFAGEHDSLEAWVVRSANASAAITRWVSGGFADATIVRDGSGDSVAPEVWPSDEIAIAGDALYVTGPDLSVAHAFLGLDEEGRAVALVVLTG